MSRPLRIEFPGATYHVTSRGDRREPIFADDVDRATLLDIVGEAVRRFDATMWAYCLMGNHYHFVLQTERANLSRLMQHINGVYSQAYNKRHGLVGHVFQGRFKAILVDHEAYLLEVCRYVELKPVRARMVKAASDWPWSSYRAHVGRASPLVWLDTGRLHEQLVGREVGTLSDRRTARDMYASLVADGQGVTLWADGLRQQIYLGDDAFVERTQSRAEARRRRSRDIPASQRGIPKTLAQWLADSTSRGEALRRAYNESGITMTSMADELKVSVASVSRWIRDAEAEHRALEATDEAPRFPKN